MLADFGAAAVAGVHRATVYRWLADPVMKKRVRTIDQRAQETRENLIAWGAWRTRRGRGWYRRRR